MKLFLSEGRTPQHDLAAELWLLERAAEGHVGLLAYSWIGPVVVLGFGQQAGDIDLEWCRSSRIPVVRRITGGTGVVHCNDLAISLALPIDHPWAQGITSLYGNFLDALAPGLRFLGSKAERLSEPEKAGRKRSRICFEDQTSDTLAIDGRKVVGCAQTRRRQSVLIHAAILLGLDEALYAKVFSVDEVRVLDGLAVAVADKNWRDVTMSVGHELASALGVDVEPTVLPILGKQWLEPWTTERWSPLIFNS